MNSIIVDGDLERAIRRLRKQMAPDLADLRWRANHPKPGDLKRVKRRRAARKRQREARRAKDLKRKYYEWLKGKRFAASKRRREQMQG